MEIELMTFPSIFCYLRGLSRDRLKNDFCIFAQVRENLYEQPSTGFCGIMQYHEK